MNLPTAGRCLVLATIAAVLAAPAHAGRRDSVADADGAIHAMLVRGSIDVGPDGKVQQYTIEDADAYTPAIREMLERVIPAWTFRPPEGDGAPHAVHSSMFLRLQARPAGDGQFKVDIASAAFRGGPAAVKTDALVSRQMAPPRYPLDELHAGVGAQVIAALRIGRDGRVEEVVIEQTNLAQTGSKRAMAQWRRDFEREVLTAAARWRFAPPTTGPDAGRDYWSVRIPSVFTAGTAAKATGHWQNFVPGPRHPVPWATQEELANAADALPDSGIFPMTPVLQLLTPLHQG